MTRRRVIAANWKMHKTRGETASYLQAVSGALGELPPDVQVVVAPPFTALEVAVEQCPDAIDIYAQNMHQGDSGAHTGEVSASMLRDVGVSGVILGHSERRHQFGETDVVLSLKVVAALEAGLQPMLCVGETLDERRAGQAEAVVRQQLLTGLQRVSGSDAAELTVAYEPVWAIGTGETATPEIAQRMHMEIRRRLGEMFGAALAGSLPVLYGGSVKPDNAAELLAQEDIDGALVGGAGLEVESFAAIVQAAL